MPAIKAVLSETFLVNRQYITPRAWK